MNQLTLLKPVTPPQPSSGLNPDLLAKMRQGSEIFLLAVNYVNDTQYRRLTDAPTEALKVARAFITPVRSEVTESVAVSVPTQLYKPYRRTSEISRCRRRITLMLNRVRKQEPLFFFERVQSKLINNPEYYGVCVLSSDGICSINPGQRLGWQRTDRAIARENELRKQGE